MEKKKHFIIGLLIIGLLTMFTFSIRKQLISFFIGSEIRNEDVSERGKKYLDSYGKKPISAPTTYSQNVTVGNCFKIFIPFTVSLLREDGVCDVHIATVNPKTTIITYMRESGNSLDEDPGVKLRRTRKDQYAEYRIEEKGRTFIVFKKPQGAYERQLFYQSGNKLFVLIFKSFSSRDLESELKNIVKSIEFTESL